jgi:hypothetical protein
LLEQLNDSHLHKKALLHGVTQPFSLLEDPGFMECLAMLIGKLVSECYAMQISKQLHNNYQSTWRNIPKNLAPQQQPL